MGILDWFRSDKPKTDDTFRADTSDAGVIFTGLNDPALLEFIRSGGDGSTALFNTAVFRAVSIISDAIGALPFRPTRKAVDGSIVEAVEHPLYEVLMHQPNAYQTAAEFKKWMTMRRLVDGQAFALIARNGSRVVALLPSDQITWRLDQFSQPIYYGPNGTINPRDVFHLKGASWHLDKPISPLRVAARALRLSEAAEDAAVSMFSSGIDPGGVLKHPRVLSPDARAAIQAGLDRNHGGAQNTGKWLLLDQGMDVTPWPGNTARDQQLIERSKHQVEEVARVFGVPRPLMGMAETNWGSGIEQLAMLFVRFALMPLFVDWEQRSRMSLLLPSERSTITFDVDERELLRGTLKDQGEFFAKALGGPGASGWMVPDEVRELSGLGVLPNGLGAAPQWGNRDVTSQAA
jgi:HK97 family phage portal protein